jgi:lipid A ethanolaminephosphotransferase
MAIAVFYPPEAGTFERMAVQYTGPIRPAARKIVMIVDESVRGDNLEINNPAYDNAPFLTARSHTLANFGTAVSAANCSVAARLILRMGLQQHQLPDTGQVWRRLPTIWDFAHRAGLRTVLLDMWRPVGLFHSYMDEQEAAGIDEWYGSPGDRDYSDDTDAYLRDVAGARMLSDLLRRDEAMLIYVNKWGVHPPYEGVVPGDYQYDPAYAGQSPNLQPSFRQAVVAYHRAVRWSVDTFFERVLPVLQQSDAVLLYTSDHGQALYEGGYELSHCSVTPDLHRGEVAVPLFVAASSPEVRALYRDAAGHGLNRATHFEVFPSLLEMMGYSRGWVESQYGATLLSFRPERPRRFLLGTFSSPASRWVNVD